MAVEVQPHPRATGKPFAVGELRGLEIGKGALCALDKQIAEDLVAVADRVGQRGQKIRSRVRVRRADVNAVLPQSGRLADRLPVVRNVLRANADQIHRDQQAAFRAVRERNAVRIKRIDDPPRETELGRAETGERHAELPRGDIHAGKARLQVFFHSASSYFSFFSISTSFSATPSPVPST